MYETSKDKLTEKQALDWISSPEFTEAYLYWRKNDEGRKFEHSATYRSARLKYRNRINGG